MAKYGTTNSGGGGGIGSDELTTIASHVLETESYVGADTDDEIGEGTMKNVAATETAKSVAFSSSNIVMRMTNGAHITNAESGYPEVQIAASNFGDATAIYVYTGKKFTSFAGLNIEGTMTVNSLLSFSAAASSGRQVTVTWKNPTAATGKPYSGVYIRYSTSSYPGKTDGTQIYKGYGNNTSSGGTSTTTITLPSLSTKYYLSIYPYATCSAGEMTGSVLNTTVTTSGTLSKTFTAGTTYTIPAGYTKMDIFCVGGGGAGGCGDDEEVPGMHTPGGGGGGGGYTKTVTGITISPGQSLAISVGAGGTATKSGASGYANSGGASSVTRSGTTLCTAAGGTGGYQYGGSGGAGGSGGGTGGYNNVIGSSGTGAGNGGTNGGNGGASGGKGQGATTRAFGASSGTAYSGGGGGGGASGSYYGGGSGGATGGGAGGIGRYRSGGSSDEPEYSGPSAGSAGSANTGGGGGGGGACDGASAYGGNGGSGIVIIKLY